MSGLYSDGEVLPPGDMGKAYYTVKKVHGKYYLYKIWWEKGRKRQISLGNCAKIEYILTNLTILINNSPAGIRTPVTGSKGRFMSDLGKRIWHQLRESSSSYGDKIVKPPEDRFLSWLSRRVSSSTLRNYAATLKRVPAVVSLEDIPSVAVTKWIAYTLRKIVTFNYEMGVLDYEAYARLKRAIKITTSSNRRVSAESPVTAIGSSWGWLYQLLMFTGARLADIYLASRLDSEIDDIASCCVRLNFNYARGNKRLEHLWLPKRLLPLLTNIRNYSYDFLKTIPRRHNLPPFLGVRKWYANQLVLLGIDADVREFLMNRFSRLTIGGQHYLRLTALADQAYASVVYPYLKQQLERREEVEEAA